MPDINGENPFLINPAAPVGPKDRVHRIAAKATIPADIADDFLRITKLESGHNPNVGPSSKGARGFAQVMPDVKGGTTRIIQGRKFNLANQDENIEAGLRYFAEGGNDPIARRLYYFGGPRARLHYERTGNIPKISDGNLTAEEYVRRTGGFQQGQERNPFLTDSLNQPPRSDNPFLVTDEADTVTPSTAPSSTVDPEFKRALDRLTRQASRITGRVVGKQRAAQRTAKIPYADLKRAEYPRNLSLAELKQSEEVRSPAIGELRREDEQAVAQSAYQRARQAQAAGARAMRNAPMSAEARLYDPRANVASEALREQTAISQEDEFRRRNQAEIDRQTEIYRQQIRSVGDPIKWLNELQARGASGLTEFLAGLPVGTKEGAEFLRIKSEAAARAAEAEGADRNVASKFVQEVIGGFAGSIPELAAMGVGVPPVATFGAGGGIRARGRGEDVFKGAAHGAATGLAFEVPVAGQGLRQVAKRSAAVGAGTTGVELAAGAEPSEALRTGATNALIVGVPGLLRGARRARQTEAQPDVTAQPEMIEPRPTTAEVGQRGVAGETPRVEVVAPESRAADTQLPETTPQRFYHKQFGEVEVLPDQTGAGRNRYRVVEVDNPEARHFVKKSDLRGRGNERMVPVKQPSAEVLPEPPAEKPQQPAEIQAAQPAQAKTTALSPEALGQRAREYAAVDKDWMLEKRAEELLSQQQKGGARESQVTPSTVGSEVTPSVEAGRTETQQPVRPAKPRDVSGRSLSQAVRAAGGIRPDRSQVNRGEISRLSNKETGTTGLVNRNSQVDAEAMALRMAERGYRGDWVEVRTEPSGKQSFNVDPNKFLNAVEADQRGIQKTVREDVEFDYDTEYRKTYPEEMKSYDNLISLMENDSAGKIYDKVANGQANKSDIEAFRRTANEYGVSEQDVAAVIRAGERAQAESRPDTSRRQAEQLGFVEEGLTQQAAPPPSTPDQRSRLIEEQRQRERAQDPERAAALDQLAAIRERGMTVDEYARQGSLLGESPAPERVRLLRELESATKPAKQVEEEPALIRQARERAEARAKEKESGIEYRRAGADPYELIDTLLIKGYEFYKKGRPKYDEWVKKMRKVFGSKHDARLPDIYARIASSHQVNDALRKARSLPQTLAASERLPGTELEYDVLPNPATIETVSNRIAKDGIEKTEAWYRNAEPSAERTEAFRQIGDQLLTQSVYEKDFAKAKELLARGTELANVEAIRSTTLGQTVQAYSINTKFSPSGALKEAATLAERAKKDLTPEDAEYITRKAVEHQEADANVKALQKQAELFEGTQRQPKSVEERIKQSGADQQVIHGATRLLKDRDMGRGEFYREMKKKFNLTQDQATTVFHKAYRLLRNSRKEQVEANRQAKIRKENPTASDKMRQEIYDNLINELKRRGDAKRDLAKAFKRLEQTNRTWWNRFTNLQRALMVSRFATAVRNAQTQFGRGAGVEPLVDAIETTIRGTFRLDNPLGYRDAWSHFTNYLHLKGQRAKAETVLQEFPTEHEQVLGRYASDVDLPNARPLSRGAETLFGKAEQGAAVLNWANTLQEFTLRSVEFNTKLNQELKRMGKPSLENYLTKGKAEDIPVEAVRAAAKAAQEITFAERPGRDSRYGNAVNSLIDIGNSIPATVSPIGFPRYFFSSMKFLWEHNPTGFLTAGFSENKPRAVSKALVGSAMLLTAYQVRKHDGGEKWYELYIPRTNQIVDMRPFGPFSLYLFLAEAVRRGVNKQQGFTKRELADAIGIATTRGAAGFVESAYDILTNQSESVQARGWKALKRTGGEAIAAFLSPIQQLKDLVAAFDESEAVRKDVNAAPFTGPIRENIPYASRGLPPAWLPTAQEPIHQEHPLLKLLTGYRIQTPKNFMQKELDRLNFNSMEIYKPSGIPEFDNRVKQLMGERIELLSEPRSRNIGYRDASDARKRWILREDLRNIRKEVIERVEGEMPEAARKLKRMRQSRIDRDLGIPPGDEPMRLGTKPGAIPTPARP